VRSTAVLVGLLSWLVPGAETTRAFADVAEAINGIRTTGARFILFGAILLITLTLLQIFQFFPQLGLKLGTELLMPLAWFGMWEGFSHLVETPYKLKEEVMMHDKLAKAQYSFKFLGETKPSTLPQAI